jgi:hypothetical protein
MDALWSLRSSEAEVVRPTMVYMGLAVQAGLNQGFYNWQPFEAFLLDVMDGIDGAFTAFRNPADGISAMVFEAKDGAITLTYWELAGGNQWRLWHGELIETFAYTDHGSFVYATRSFDTVHEWWLPIRMAHENAVAYAEMYVAPIHWWDGPFYATWDAHDLRAWYPVWWDCVFGALFYYETGVNLQYMTHPSIPVGSDSLMRVPADIWESTLMAYFPVTVETLRALESFCADTETYLHNPGGGTGVAFPRVSAIQYNLDGTLALTLDYFDWGHLRFQNTLTVRPLETGGFQYVSNVRGENLN